MNICTIIAKNYVSHARVLAQSFAATHPGGKCSVLVVDDFDGYIDPDNEPFETIGIDEIGLPDPEAMAAAYDVTELSTGVKPWLLRHLLDRDGVETVTYLDPDIWVARSLEPVGELARRHGVVLTPHFTEPLPRDGLKPAEEDILIAGTYNLGFISLGAGKTADALLDWWSQRLERNCLIEPDKGLFVDQRWIDLVPGFWPDTAILRETQYNIAYWNLPTRRLEIDGDGFTVDGDPLRFFHFSGFDPLRPGSLSKHQNRVSVRDSEPLSRACAHYAELLLEQGYREVSEWPYGWADLPNGIRLDGPARRLFREGSSDGDLKSSPFGKRGAKRFASYLSESPNGGVSRYARALRDSRVDLIAAFPDIDGKDAASFESWMHDSADALRISDLLLPTRGGSGDAVAAANGHRAHPAADKGDFGVNLAGYLSSELGVGEAARQVLEALTAAGVPATGVDVPVQAAEFPATIGKLADADLPFDFNLICVNADMLPSFAEASSAVTFDGRHSAGLWFWEVEQFPEAWHDSFRHIDEIWTATEFVAEALRPISTVPVTTIRVPVTPVEPATMSRAELGMPEEGFCFLYIFDYRSVFRRKNPLGAIEAFRLAFEPESGASLVIKTVGAEAAPESAAVLAAEAARHPDVHLVDGRIGAAEKNAMIAACDCYVSLHRSEGLGLTIAEAMYFSKPVIATSYSGNLDFMTAENSLPVDYELARIGEDAAPYPPAGRWAEPNLAHAAELMKSAAEDPERSARLGRRAAAEIRASHSPEAAGKLLEEHLAAVRRRRVLARLGTPGTSEASPNDSEGSEPRPNAEDQPAVMASGAALVPSASAAIDPTTGRAQLHHLLRFDQPPPRQGAGRLRRFLKRAYLRLMQPYSSHQHRIDLSTRQSIDELSSEIASLQRQVAREREQASADLERASSELKRDQSSRIGELQNQQAGFEDRLLGAADAIEHRLRESIDEGRKEAKSNADAVESLATRTATLQGALETLDAALEATAQTIQGIQVEAQRGVEAGNVLEGRTEALREQLNSNQEQVMQAVMQAASAEARITDLRREESEHHAQTGGAINDLRSRLEAATGVAGAKPYMSEDRFPEHEDPDLGSVIGFDRRSAEADGYVGFEDLFRGPEEMIKERQRVYVDLVAGSAPVFDAGCGRGEFLELLRDAGIEARGCDLDEGMVTRCRAKGLETVEKANLIEVLEEMPEGELGTIFSAQVIEHLDVDDLRRFLDLASTRLKPGGLLITETVNPHSALAMKAFWVDPTHRQPLFPETMLALCELAGFAAAKVFCPLGDRDWESDRLTEGEYAIVARAPTKG